MVAAGVLASTHRWFAWLVVAANGIAGLWALAAHRWPGLRRRQLWWFTAAAEIAIFVQVGLGVGVLVGDDIEVEQFHMFYGFIALMSVGLIYSYRQQLAAHIYLLYGGGGVFLMGLGLRAIFIDPV